MSEYKKVVENYKEKMKTWSGIPSTYDMSKYREALYQASLSDILAVQPMERYARFDLSSPMWDDDYVEVFYWGA